MTACATLVKNEKFHEIKTYEDCWTWLCGGASKAIVSATEREPDIAESAYSGEMSCYVRHRIMEPAIAL